MKLLIPVDGSAHSNAALEFVAARAPLGRRVQVEVLSVVMPVQRGAGRRVYEAEAKAMLKPALAVLQQAGIEAKSSFRVGHPSRQIAGWADRHGTDLIVMGSHGHTLLATLLFGSVTQGVLACTRVPVLLIRTAHAPKGKSLRVGIAIDGSGYGRTAARYVLENRALFGPSPVFSLLHVVELRGDAFPSARGKRLNLSSTRTATRGPEAAAAERALAPVRRLFGAEKLEPREVCVMGRPGVEIGKLANDLRLDLLVMGSHGRGALTSALLGSVAWRVAATCSTPLLLIRAEG